MRSFAPKPQATQQHHPVGNQAVQRVLRSHVEEPKVGSTVTASPRFGHDFSRIPIHSPTGEKIQTKLPISRPGDHSEQEADFVADQVMRMSPSKIQSQQPGVPAQLSQSDSGEHIQRLAGNRSPSLEDAVVLEEEERNAAEQGQVQTLRPLGQKSGREAVSKGLLNSSQGSVSLGSNTRQFMEPRFGVDFSRVQIHADSRAAALSQSLSARAFAYGRHIYFNQGEYQPETQEGKRVLAHELTHVIQQGQARLPAEQQGTESKEANLSPTIQRLGAPGAALKENVAPWKGNGPTGTNYAVDTDGGSVVHGWKAYPVWAEELCYWCHGHSLGTYNKHGYSIYSGSSLKTVIKDEWTSVAPDQTQAGDIAVWTIDFDHSALFTKPVIENGLLKSDKSILSTKNGPTPLAVKTLTNIKGTYGPLGVEVFRHK